MVLYLQDWQKYKSAVIHWTTKNTSYLDMAAKYKLIGIENSFFFLALHNPQLQHIDPHSEHLTLREKAMIAMECRQNPWYYFREVARAPAIAGTKPGPVLANRSTIALWWCFFNHITIILTQPRQTGKSFATDQLMTELYNFLCNNTQINLLTKDDTLRSANIARLKDIYDELPGYLKFKDKTDTNNTESITINRFNNKYIAHVPQSSPKNAYKLGRGLTSPIIHVDEGPFQPNIEIAMGSALGAMGAAIDKAKEEGEPYGTIITSTAGKKDDPSGKYVYSLIEASAVFNEIFFDAKDETELRKLVCSNSKKGAYRVYACFSHIQLGKTDEWLKEKLNSSMQSPDDANRDFFNIWTSGSEYSPIPTHLLELMVKTVVDPTIHEIFSIGKYIVRWYIPENTKDHFLNTRKIVMNVDTSDASGGDDISTVFIDVETGAVVGAGTYNETNLITYAQWLVHVLEKYENITLVIERRSSAITILDYILLLLVEKGIDPFKRIFNWVVNDPLEHKSLAEEIKQPMRRRSEDLYVRAKKTFGFATSGSGQQSRSELYSVTLQHAIKRCADKIYDRPLVSQITGLIIKNGRIDHRDGENDDMVIAFLLGHWFITSAKNLMHYGIDPTKVLVESKPQQQIAPKLYYMHIEQQRIRNRIQEIYEKLQLERDTNICKMYERELMYLDSKIVLQDGEHYSVDAIIKEAEKARKDRYSNFRR